jgi:hypothetical protein
MPSTNIALAPPIIPANIEGPEWLGWVNKSEVVVWVGEVVDSEDTVWDVVLNVDEGEVARLDEVLGRAPVNVITLGNV